VDLRPKEDGGPKRSTPSPNILVAGIVVVTTLGLFAIILLMFIMSEGLHSPVGLINGFAGVMLLLLLLVDALFALLLLRSKKTSTETTQVAQLREAILAELQAAQISGFAQPPGSVTDHTTRTLEAVPRTE
jgi:hypothetical protein